MRGMGGVIYRYSAFLCAIAAAVTLLSSPAKSAPASGEARIAVVTPLSFINYRNLDFGRVIPAAVAGSVTISPTNTRTATAGIIPVGNDFQVARFAGMGAQNDRVRVRITPSVINLTGPGPAMTVDSFIIGPESTLQQIGGSQSYRIMAANGVFWFSVGARLNVGANQPAGTYSGTFTATLDYQ